MPRRKKSAFGAACERCVRVDGEKPLLDDPSSGAATAAAAAEEDEEPLMVMLLRFPARDTAGRRRRHQPATANRR